MIDTVYDLPHVAEVHAIGTTGVYRITMEDGYWIHIGNNVWKTVTLIYPNEDLNAIDIRATADLPEGAELLGGVDPETEVM